MDTLDTLETFYLENKPGLYLTNPSNTNNLLLAEKAFSPNQTWHWSGNMLKCGTGKVLDIDGNYKAGPGAPVLAWEPHGGINQQFYFVNVEGSGFFIGRIAEKDEQNEAYVHVTEKGEAFMAPLDFSDSINPNMHLTWRRVSTKPEINPPYKWKELPENAHWRELPENALAAGRDHSDIFNVFPARGEVGENILLGKVHIPQNYINRFIGYDTEERKVTSEKFSVLCVEPDTEIEWVEYQDGKFNQFNHAVDAGTSYDGKTNYVGRGIIQDQITPGMFVPVGRPEDRGEQQVTEMQALYGGKVHLLTKFEVLVVRKEGDEKVTTTEPTLNERKDPTDLTEPTEPTEPTPDTVYMIQHVETAQLLFLQATKVTKRGIEEGWLESPSILGSDDHHNNGTGWTVEKISSEKWLITHWESNRLLFSGNDKDIRQERGSEKGWQSADKVVGSDANYYNLAYWKLVPQGHNTFLIEHSQTGRYLFVDQNKGSVGEGNRPCPSEVLVADDNYYGLAVWKFVNLQDFRSFSKLLPF